jgi:hypothetical protein
MPAGGVVGGVAVLVQDVRQRINMKAAKIEERVRARIVVGIIVCGTPSFALLTTLLTGMTIQGDEVSCVVARALGSAKSFEPQGKVVFASHV